MQYVSPEDITAKVRDAPDAVKHCATDDKVCYTRGGCELLGASACPFQAKNKRAVFDNVKFVACTRFHPYFQNGQPQV